MNRIRANLKIAVSEPWVVWALFAIGVGVYICLVLAEAYNDRFEWSGLWIPFYFILGRLVVGWHEPEGTTAKPLSFLLPGYQESLRRSGFMRAVRWGVGFCLWVFSGVWSRLLLFWRVQEIYSRSPSGVSAGVSLPAKPDGLEISLSMIIGFLSGAALCLLWANGSLVQFRRKWMKVMFLGIGTAVPVLVMWVQGTEHAFLIWPMLIPLSIFYCVYFWTHLGDMEWVKNGHRAMILQRMERSRGIVAQVRSDRYVAQRRAHRRVEKLFLDRMRKGGAEAAGRYVWAWLYLAFAPILEYWRWLAVPLVAGVLVQGFVGRWLVEVAIFLLGAILAVNVLPVTSSLLLPEGRRQKYHLAVVAAVVTTALLLAVSIIIVALSWVLTALLPPISWGAHHWEYAGIPMGSLLLVCVPVPWVFLSGSLWQRASILRKAPTVVVAVLAVGEIFARHHGLYAGPTVLPVLLLAGWLLLPLTVWLTYQHWDLIGPRPIRAD